MAGYAPTGLSRFGANPPYAVAPLRIKLRSNKAAWGCRRAAPVARRDSVRSWECNPPAPRRPAPPFSCWGAAKRYDIVIGRAEQRHAFRACHLDPEIAVLLQEPVKALVLRVIDALLHVGC